MLHLKHRIEKSTNSLCTHDIQKWDYVFRSIRLNNNEWPNPNEFPDEPNEYPFEPKPLEPEDPCIPEPEPDETPEPEDY